MLAIHKIRRQKFDPTYPTSLSHPGPPLPVVILVTFERMQFSFSSLKTNAISYLEGFVKNEVKLFSG